MQRHKHDEGRMWYYIEKLTHVRTRTQSAVGIEAVPWSEYFVWGYPAPYRPWSLMNALSLAYIGNTSQCGGSSPATFYDGDGENCTRGEEFLACVQTALKFKFFCISIQREVTRDSVDHSTERERDTAAQSDKDKHRGMRRLAR